MKLMLHACCGPCSLEPVRIFAEEGAQIALDYTNPNIHPREEYEHRLSTIREHVAQPQGIELYESPYDVEAWEREAGVHGTDRPARCRACYRLRLEAAAQRAEELGYDALCTTLTISPYQFTGIILEELEAAAARHGLQALLRDFRDRYQEATRRSRELGMYRQNYCGCRFSIAEAAAEREERKRIREAEKRAKHRALIWASLEGAFNQESQL